MIKIRNSVTGTTLVSAPKGLGDFVERMAKPIAVALKLNCIDAETRKLKPDSPCAHRRDALNKLGKAIGL